MTCLTLHQNERRASTQSGEVEKLFQKVLSAQLSACFAPFAHATAGLQLHPVFLGAPGTAMLGTGHQLPDGGVLVQWALSHCVSLDQVHAQGVMEHVSPCATLHAPPSCCF